MVVMMVVVMVVAAAMVVMMVMVVVVREELDLLNRPLRGYGFGSGGVRGLQQILGIRDGAKKVGVGTDLHQRVDIRHGRHRRGGRR